MSEKIKCLKCGSDQLTADKKGFSGKKAAAGAILTGGIGLLAGTIGSNDVKITCLNCGNTWNPKKYTEQKEQANAQQEAEILGYWKREFFGRYESGNMIDAEEYYKTNSSISQRIPDFHEGYKHLKRGDNQMTFLGLLIVVIVVVAFVLIIRSC